MDIFFKKYNLIDDYWMIVWHTYEYASKDEYDFIKIDIIWLKKKKYISIWIWHNNKLVTDVIRGTLKLPKKTYNSKWKYSSNYFSFSAKRKIYKKINNFLFNSWITSDKNLLYKYK